LPAYKYSEEQVTAHGSAKAQRKINNAIYQTDLLYENTPGRNPQNHP
jgi:hypothetical protein